MVPISHVCVLYFHFSAILFFKYAILYMRKPKALREIMDPSSKRFVQDEGHYWSKAGG